MPRKCHSNTRSSTQNISWESLLQEFLLWKSAQGASPRTLHDYSAHINLFFSRFPEAQNDYSSLRRCLLSYLGEPIAPATKNLRITYLKAFFAWCVKEGYLPENPATGIKKIRDDGRIRHISLEDVERLLKQPNRKTYTGMRDYCMMLLQLDTGIRPSEMVELLPGDVNLEAREIYIRPETAKARIARTLPISPFTAQVIAQFLKLRPSWWSKEVPLFASENGRKLSSWWWCKRFQKYRDMAGIDATPYSLRHTAAIELLRNGADAFAVQRILGHSTLDMTRRYIKLSQEDIKEAHEKASPVYKLSMPRRARRKLE
ncbi:Site-specific recombinase XerD [Thermanaeromonas toyohensis ToBE]|uniref:Site-specific recombinase XerD n=1 Tax=Thermanaeromonas toyohensis ToBE TaxID=698762 RepID=A0A1W1VX66_9FIRM|nr:tyrosine-type recombinase/integrase [Thermanaeromonas toyohensis]SMB97701.1 Site-specific recombinase XerD [Thermanaeromonas toyohensis ToBE]